MTLARHGRWIAAGAALLALVGALVARQIYTRHDLNNLYADAIAESLGPTRADVEAWARRRVGQAALLHLVVRQSNGATSSATLRHLFRDVVTMEHDAGIAYLAPSTGESVAVGTLSVPVPQRAGITLVPTRTGAHVLFTVDGSAPARSDPDDGAHQVPPATQPAHARLLLAIEAVPAPDAFVSLDPASSDSHTGRTTLLAQHGDSVLVVATKSNGNAPFPRAFLLARAPAYVRAALAGRQVHGAGRGLRGRPVVFAAAPVLGPGWALVREQDESEIYDAYRTRIFLGHALYATLGILLILVALGTERVVRTRRERLLTEFRADFVASASHELRTPLAKVKMFAQLLQNGALQSESDAQRALSVIEKESDRLAILVDNLLSFSRLRHRVASGEVMPSDVAEVATQVGADFTALAAERNVMLEIHVPPDLVVSVDSSALRQILINFLENAVKYGPAGQTIRLSAVASGDFVRVQVEDEGTGVAAHERTEIWKAFYRGPAAVSSGEGGSGIGLSVVHDLVSHVGGRVAVEDAPTGGARFIADLPRLRR